MTEAQFVCITSDITFEGTVMEKEGAHAREHLFMNSGTKPVNFTMGWKNVSYVIWMFSFVFYKIQNTKSDKIHNN